MGADMMLTITQLPHNANNEPVYGTHVVSELCDRLDTLDFKELLNIGEDYLWAYIEDKSDLEVTTEVVQRLQGLFADWFGTEPQSRDVCRIQIQGRWYLATGGLSWGDSPTDAFDDIMLLERVEDLFDDPIPDP